MKGVTYVHPVTAICKRAMDMTIAIIGLILALPLFPIIAIAIKLDSPGPVFYKQMRIGYQRSNYISLFQMVKFRSMRADAEAKSGPVWAQKNDPRITRLGNSLRKTRLDELPQLWNVLVGDMSIVGPRPERPGICNKLERNIPFYTERTYDVVPGLTGLAQVNLGYDESIDDVRNKVAYDHAYALALSSPVDWLKMDTFIMFKTFMVLGKGQ
ncbi:sugar transferase [Endozoicomonas montiporae]|uniref:Sugar transferase n=2 Tax=Endozoicomonas montiporae TaxID=1027273 RepID=A0A081N4F9_9GAMM|nr:sugar transferase [Endozoicomonas montiporae]AMO57819.1 putative sugar transferase SypR involved in lipopolysaccharide synthesis [Endozoicomonas montiporae CL-33]KEQ13332.1 sugar transferase [Endozoicomonas montiporae]